MTAQPDPYVRVYYRVIDDPKFREVFDDDARLACWMRLLLIADGTYPAPAPIPAGIKRSALTHLVTVGLIDLEPGGRYRIHGMDTERGARSRRAADAAAESWRKRRGDAVAMQTHSVSNASASAPNMHSAPLRSEQLHSAPSSANARAHEGMSYGLPNLTPDVIAAAEEVTSRSIATLHGTWASELDRLVEDRGPDAVSSAMRRAAASIGKRPSWPQLVAGVRNLLEPLPSSIRGAPMVDDPIEDAVRRIREGKL